MSLGRGPALDALRDRLGARLALPLYGHVDPAVHGPAAPDPAFAGDLSFLGTYAEDRQATLERLLVEPARRTPERRFVIAGAQYPDRFPWSDNIWFVRHLAPNAHPAFYASARMTLNVTRRAMAENGWCPSGRLFEAAACGAVVLTDVWPGLSDFFEPGPELLTAESADDTLAALALTDAELGRIGQAARDRVLAEHTSDARARDFEAAIGRAVRPSPVSAAGERQEA